MQKKEIVLTLELLTEKGACNRGIEEFKRWYPNGHVPLSEVFRKLQELANTSTNYLTYVSYAKWLLPYFPPTQEPLALNELTEKVIIHNGDINIKSGIDGERFIIGNGDLNIKSSANLTGYTYIWVKKGVKAINIAAYDRAEILAGTIDAQKIAAKDFVVIRAWETIDTINIAAKDYAGIWAEKINTQNIMDGDRTRIHGDINLIQHSYN